MRRLLVVLAAVFALVAGGGSHPLKAHRCHGLAGVAWVCNAAADVKPPPPFAVKWSNAYNAQLQKANSSIRVVGVGHCERWICVALVHDASTGKLGCFEVTLSPAGKLRKPAPPVSCSFRPGAA